MRQHSTQLWVTYCCTWLVYRPRQHGGVRISWGTTEPSFLQRWNPVSVDLGYVTLSHHLLAYKPEERETSMYDAGDFIDSAIAAANKVRSGSEVNCENNPITIESYGSVMSMIFNQSHIGFNLARGGVSFWLYSVFFTFHFTLELVFCMLLYYYIALLLGSLPNCFISTM